MNKFEINKAKAQDALGLRLAFSAGLAISAFIVRSNKGPQSKENFNTLLFSSLATVGISVIIYAIAAIESENEKTLIEPDKTK